MRIKNLQTGICAAMLIAATMAASPASASTPADPTVQRSNGSTVQRSNGSTVQQSNVILIGVDGFGARWIPWDVMPNLSALRDDGIYAVARCHRITASAINWKSVFSGLPPEIHGFNKWNSTRPDIAPHPAALDDSGATPDLFAEIRRQRPDAWTASLYTWGGVGFCHATNTASVARHFGGSGDAFANRDDAVFDEGLRQLRNQPDFMFLYQGQVDHAGHGFSWGSPEYTNACRNVDANIGRFVDGLRHTGLWDDTAVILVADHGGLDKGHGGKEDVRVFDVPFLISGGAARALRLREPIQLMDTAPTVLSLLGLEIPDAMRGRPAAIPAR